MEESALGNTLLRRFQRRSSRPTARRTRDLLIASPTSNRLRRAPRHPNKSKDRLKPGVPSFRNPLLCTKYSSLCSNSITSNCCGFVHFVVRRCIGADSTGATGNFAPVLTQEPGQTLPFAPVPYLPKHAVFGKINSLLLINPHAVTYAMV